MKICTRILGGIWIVLAVTNVLVAQSVSDCYTLKASSGLGIPLHPASGDRAVSGRLDDGTVAKIITVGSDAGWFEIKSGDVSGWIITKYLGNKVNCPGTTTSTLSVPSIGEYVIGAWNLEWFDMEKGRGFPENTNGGPHIPARTHQDFLTVASIIEELGAKILVLEEISANSVGKSQTLDSVIAILGNSNFAYIAGTTGGEQHIAILYDKRNVTLNSSCEFDLPEKKVDNKNLFDRQPLGAHFAFTPNGQQKNDIFVVGVHLASGQQNKKNHDEAMKQIVEKIDKIRTDGECLPSNEQDVVIMGDFNANRFDTYQEKFWDDMEKKSWDVLADNPTYPTTRLSGVPLAFKDSKIDYIIVSKGQKGLQGEEVNQTEATVHQELVKNSPDNFRKFASDHVPVTIKVKVMDDTDP